MLILLRQHPAIAMVGGLLFVLLLWGFWPQPITLTTVSVAHAPMTVSIEEEGQTRLIDRYAIAAPIDGVACRIELEVGDPVSKGQILLHISPLASQSLDARSRARAEAQVDAAESARRAAEERVQSAETSAQLAATELQRMAQLIEPGLISREQYDRAVAEANSTAAGLRSAKFSVDVANHELQAAKAVLEYSANSSNQEPVERVPVRSPIDGQIIYLGNECERPVQTGELLMEVGDPTALEIEVDVLSADAVKIKPGMPVLFERWGGDQPLEGMVRTVEPVAYTRVSALGVDEQRVLVISDFLSPLEQWRALGDGYRVDARFILWQKDDALQIPSSSLFRYRDGWAVFVVEDLRAKRREVVVGQRNGLVAEVLAGLESGEQVISHPDNHIEDGVRVRVIDHARN